MCSQTPGEPLGALMGVIQHSESMPLSAMWHQAATLHSEGRLPEAAGFCEAILARQPQPSGTATGMLSCTESPQICTSSSPEYVLHGR